MSSFYLRCALRLSPPCGIRSADVRKHGAHLRSITRTRAQRGRRGFQSPRRLELNASYTVASISGGQFRDAVDRLKTPLLHKPRPRPTDNPLRRTLTSVQTLSCAHHGRRLSSSPQTPYRDDNVDGEFLLA